MSLAVKLPMTPAALPSHRRYPHALHVLDGHQTAVQRQLRRSGLAGYEPLTQATLLALAQHAPPGTAFYDVGAHIGLYSALVRVVTGSDGPDVYAFEPAPATAATARQLRDRNALSYQVHETALSDTRGSAELYLSLKAETSHSLNPGHRRHEDSVRVPVTTVDQFTTEHHLTPHLIKIDVETLEAQVLAGALETFHSARPWVICELLPSCDHDAVRAVLERILAFGYYLYCLQLEAPWRPRTAANYQAKVGHHGRDWLLAPRTLSNDWYRRMRQWLIAILACDEHTNLTAADGQSLTDACRGGASLSTRDCLA